MNRNFYLSLISSLYRANQWYEPRGKPRSVFRPKGRGINPQGIKKFLEERNQRFISLEIEIRLLQKNQDEIQLRIGDLESLGQQVKFLRRENLNLKSLTALEPETGDLKSIEDLLQKHENF